MCRRRPINLYKGTLLIAFVALIMLPDVCAAAAALPLRMTLEQKLKSLSSTSDVLKRRDPFMRMPSPFAPVLSAVVDRPKADPDAIDLSKPDLLRYPSNRYKLMAVLLGDVYPRALVGTPDGKVFVVREKDKLGNQRGYIRRIQEDAIIVSEGGISGLGKFVHSDMRISLAKPQSTEAATAKPKPTDAMPTQTNGQMQVPAPGSPFIPRGGGR